MDEREFMKEIMDEETLDHIQEVMPHEIEELMEFHSLAYKLAGKVNRRTMTIKKHMMTCGDCINRQIKLEMLIPIGEFYEQGQAMGMGRLPKLHYMAN